MKRKNVTRNALFTSIISLLLCVSMLVGTTFAWFTDSVESGRNTIAAGNLDVELYANGNPVNSATVLFDDVNPNLWEPGAVAYENLEVKNVGTLALQYDLLLNFVDVNKVADNGLGLSDVLQIAVSDEHFTAADRDTLTSTNTFESIKAFNGDGKLLPGEEAQLAIAIWWEPKSAEYDNQWNVNNGRKTTDGDPLMIDIGLNVFAQQLPHESDSFGNDYDKQEEDQPGAPVP